MAITSQLIGKLGGADIEVIPVTAPEGKPYTLLRAITVPAGKKYLVAALGHCPKMPSNKTYHPTLSIGDTKSQPTERYVEFGVVATVENSVEVRFDPYSSSGSFNSTYEGTVYVVEL